MAKKTNDNIKGVPNNKKTTISSSPSPSPSTSSVDNVNVNDTANKNKKSVKTKNKKDKSSTGTPLVGIKKPKAKLKDKVRTKSNSNANANVNAKGKSKSKTNSNSKSKTKTERKKNPLNMDILNSNFYGCGRIKRWIKNIFPDEKLRFSSGALEVFRAFLIKDTMKTVQNGLLTRNYNKLSLPLPVVTTNQDIFDVKNLSKKYV